MSNVATILITAPERAKDPTTYTHMWATKARSMAEGLGYNVVFIERDDTTYDRVSSAIKEYHPRLYIHMGHGCSSSLQGQNSCIVNREYTADELVCMATSSDPNERSKILRLLSPLGQLSCPGICSLDVDPCSPFCNYPTNINLLKGAICLAVACHSSSQLGRCAIAYGVQSYIGYKDLLMFVTDNMQTQDLFGDMQLVMVKELLTGKSVSEANEIMKSIEDSYITLYKNTKYVALPILWDQTNREVLGDPNARIY